MSAPARGGARGRDKERDAEVVAAREALDALRRGDRKTVVSLLDPEVRVRASGPLWTRRYRGVDALIEAYEDARRSYSGTDLSVHSVERDEDGSILVKASIGASEPDGHRVGAELLGVFFFNGGRITRVYMRSRRHRRARG